MILKGYFITFSFSAALRHPLPSHKQARMERLERIKRNVKLNPSIGLWTK